MTKLVPPIGVWAAMSSGHDWSTASGKRLHGMVPRTAIDVRTVEPAKKMRTSTSNALVVEQVQDVFMPAKSQKLKEFLGPCCGGSHFWGHGNGFDNGKGGKFWKCNNGCKKPLNVLPLEEQEKRRALCVHCQALAIQAAATTAMTTAEARELAELAMEAYAMD